MFCASQQAFISRTHNISIALCLAQFVPRSYKTAAKQNLGITSYSGINSGSNHMLTAIKLCLSYFRLHLSITDMFSQTAPKGFESNGLMLYM